MSATDVVGRIQRSSLWRNISDGRRALDERGTYRRLAKLLILQPISDCCWGRSGTARGSAPRHSPSANVGGARPWRRFRPTYAPSVLPEPIEAVGAQLGISHRVHDVAVTQEVLQRAGIDAVIGKLEAAGVAQHVRMNGKWKFGQFPSPADHFEEPGPRHWAAAFGIEHVAALQVLPSHLA